MIFSVSGSCCDGSPGFDGVGVTASLTSHVVEPLLIDSLADTTTGIATREAATERAHDSASNTPCHEAYRPSYGPYSAS